MAIQIPVMNNILKIENFISFGRDNTLLINQVSEEIMSFYEFVIRDITSKFNIKINYNKTNDDVDFSNNLFGVKEINIFNSNSIKLVEEIARKSYHKIIFTDYKNYKKLLGKFISINGYDFRKDLEFFLNNNCEINNKDLINTISERPYLTFSEVSKYRANRSGYFSNPIKDNPDNTILQIRKNISLSKKSNVNFKKLFTKIKEEVQYKKFSFLIY